MPISIGILGATGYTGGELVRLLTRHPEVKLEEVTSERYAGKSLSKAFPHLRGEADLICRPMATSRIAEQCPLVFCALPHLASMAVVPEFLEAGCRVIDLSADFRLKDAKVYEEWYGEPHAASQLLPEAVYGLSELYREEITQARLVANPGCYPTSVLLGLAPLLTEALIDPDCIVVDSKSGVSGAGRSAVQGSLYCEVAEGFRAYKATGHRHTPEMEQELGKMAGRPLQIRFTPHLLPQSRGILSTCYVRPKVNHPPDFWQKHYERWYHRNRFVRVMPMGELPATGQVRGSNYCDMAVVLDNRTGWLLVLVVIDNLVKGAAGQAVQNMNLMLGFDEATGLEQMPIFP